MVRILIVSQYFHPEQFRVNQLAESLHNRGHEVTVLTGQPNYPTGKFFSGYKFFGPLTDQWNGMELIRVPIIPRFSGKPWQLALNYLSFAIFSVLFGLPRLRGRYDACVVFCPSPITSAFPAIVRHIFWRTPVAIWLQDLWPESVLAVTRSRSRIFRKALSLMVQWIYRRVDQIWIQSPAYRKHVEFYGGQVPQVSYVPNWAEDLYDCYRWADISSDPIPNNSLIFAGNLGHAQGLETLIEAATITHKSAPAAHWIFVGNGSLCDWLCEEIGRRGLDDHVTVLPWRAPADLPKILKPSMAALVSLRGDDVFSQTIPSKVPSCLASGRPVIAMTAGAAAEILNEACCGFVCEPGNATALAEAVSKLLSLPEQERLILGRNGHAYYRKHFTQAQILLQIDELLERLRSSAL